MLKYVEKEKHKLFLIRYYCINVASFTHTHTHTHTHARTHTHTHTEENILHKHNCTCTYLKVNFSEKTQKPTVL